MLATLLLLALQGQEPPIRLQSNVMIPMRDGVRLATDLYRPATGDGPWPVVLSRTPYNKVHDAERFKALVSAGYLLAVQDVRGKYASEGRFRVQADDANDGYDTVDWLAKQPWSTGKIGTTGCSYPGEAQIFLAKRHHPAHAAMIPQAAAGPNRYLSVINGGAYELALMFGWLRAAGSLVHLQPAPGTPDSLVELARPFVSARQSLPDVDFQTAWRTLPLAEMNRRVPGPPTEWEAFVTHGPGDSWWRQFNLLEPTDTIAAPGLHVGSWYDYGVTETLAYFTRFSRSGADERTRRGQFLVIAPTTHCGFERATEHTVVGARDVGDARFDYAGLYRRWFDHWLKGLDNGMMDQPRIRYYVMGRDQWRSANQWPLPGTQVTAYYLRSDGNANSRFGSGRLSLEPPREEPSDDFVYDPATPVPSKGGALCCAGSPDAQPGAYDQSDIEVRSDVLVYSTPPLERGVEVTGSIEAELYLSSSARDTDLTVKLIDVYPDGTAYNVQEGIQRVRYRDGDQPALMVPGQVYRVTVNVHATSNYFGPGHRIRVEVSSSNFPRFDRNLNTGGDNSRDTEMVVARNRIHHSATHPSRLLLPVVP